MTTRTVRQIVNKALRKASLLDISEEAEAELSATTVEELDAMLKAWQGQPWMWTRTSGLLTLTTAASYTLDPVRPLQIITARLKRNGIETPMQPMTRREYDELPIKTSTGLPTTFYYDRQREAALFYIWPVLSVAAGEQIAYTYTREVADIASPNDEIDVPGEWWDCVILNLAARMAMEFDRPKAPMLASMAKDALMDASAMEMDEPITFEVDW